MPISRYFYSGSSLYEKLNEWGGLGIPFLFILDFEGKEGYIIPKDQLGNSGVYFQTPGQGNHPSGDQNPALRSIKFQKSPLTLDTYARHFSKVIQAMDRGETYLLNLTFSTPVQIDQNLLDLFNSGISPYKLLFLDEFLVFSPEPFIRIQNGRIYSYPMKGTSRVEGIGLNTDHPSYTIELDKLLNNRKEMAEHATIVDLIRNDLNRVSKRVRVEKYRYPDRIESKDQTLIQLSSEISGELPEGYAHTIGTILESLLPAGSISGAPKKKTLELIKEIETHKRAYYTGIFGVFDGKDLDSAVMIRFLEKTETNQFVFKSGGGITSQSRLEDEYEELIHKIYVPII